MCGKQYLVYQMVNNKPKMTPTGMTVWSHFFIQLKKVHKEYISLWYNKYNEKEVYWGL